MGNTSAIVGRLKPGAPLEGPQPELNILGPQFHTQHPERNEFQPILSPLKEHVTGRLRPALLVLACAAGVVMLIVCANPSNLLLARNATRQKEMSTRAALGAARRRLGAQLLHVVMTSSGPASLLSAG